MKKILVVLLAVMLSAGFAFANEGEKAEKADNSDKMEKTEKAEVQKEKKMADLDWKKTELGIKYFDKVEGTGKAIKMGDKFECHYTLWFADENGEKKTRFQSSKDANPRSGKVETFKWTLGQGLIQGWSDGMNGMKEGGTRVLAVPSKYGYGPNSNGPIPGNQNLIFEIELIKVIEM